MDSSNWFSKYDDLYQSLIEGYRDSITRSSSVITLITSPYFRQSLRRTYTQLSFWVHDSVDTEDNQCLRFCDELSKCAVFLLFDGIPAPLGTHFDVITDRICHFAGLAWPDRASAMLCFERIMSSEGSLVLKVEELHGLLRFGTLS